MQRSFAWGMIAILAIMLAPFAGVLGMPASAVHADAASPTAAPLDDEIIVITSALQVRVDDPTTPTGYQPATWSSASESGWETGWTLVAGGDFNGDGDAELVAARNSVVKVFDPIVQPGRARVDFSVDFGSGWNVKFLNIGDFDGDGKDEFAVIHFIQGSGNQAGLQVYDGGANATKGEWTLRDSASYGAMFDDMSVGDFNADGADDLVMVRNASGQRLLLVLNVSHQLATIAQGSGYCCDWFAVAGGNLSTSTPGDEIALTRYSANAATASLILFKVVSGGFANLLSNPPAWNFNPEFRSLSNGDLNGDGDDEVVMLRDPVNPSTSLLSVNPAGAAMNPSEFAQATGAGSAAFRIVRTGDTDGDRKDEVVILRADRYYLYTEPDVSGRVEQTPGSFYTPGGVSNLPFMALANVDGPGVPPPGPTLSVTPASLSFSLDCAAASPVRPLSITNSGTGSSFEWKAQAIEDNGSAWLLIDTTSGTTPGTVNVSVRPGIAKGTYTGKIRITATDATVQNRTVDVPVSYTAVCSGFAVSPTALSFNMSWGSTASQSVVISAAGPTAWTTTVAPVAPTSSCNWLTLSATSGTTPSTVNVVANSATAGVGSRRCSIIYSAVDPSVPNSPQYVTVNLTVPDPGFVVSPAELTIRQAIGASTVTREVKIERPSAPTTWVATALPLSAAASLEEKLATGQANFTADGLIIDGVLVPPPSWLGFTPDSGTTPSTMTVKVVTDTPGTYRGVIIVAANDPSPANPVQLVYVTAVVADFKFSFLPLVMQ